MNAKHLALVRDLRQLGGTVCMDAAAALEAMERQILELSSKVGFRETQVTGLERALEEALRSNPWRQKQEEL